MSSRYVGRVVSIVDHCTIVIDLGGIKGLDVGDEFLVVGFGDEIKDPDTGEVLERLEVLRGRGVVTHVQVRIATLVSCTRTYVPKAPERKVNPYRASVSSSSVLYGLSKYLQRDLLDQSSTEVESQSVPFRNPQVGDQIIRA